MQKNAGTESDLSGVELSAHWISTSEAMREVMAAYDACDFTEYGTDEIRKSTLYERAASAILRRLSQGSLRASASAFDFWTQQGRNQISLERGIIPKLFWLSFVDCRLNAEEDWTAGDFAFSSNTHDFMPSVEGFAHGVRLDRNGLPAINSPTTIPDAGSIAPRGRGAPSKWDWEGALLHLAAVAFYDSDGLFREDGGDPNQSDIAQRLSDWFFGTTGNTPADSQLRNYGKRFQQELNALKLAAANKSKPAS